MKKMFLTFASLAFALSAGAKNVNVTVLIPESSFAEKSYVKVEGESADLTVKINGTECVFDGATGRLKSGTPDLSGGVESALVRYEGRTMLDIAKKGEKVLVNGKPSSVWSSTCDAMAIVCGSTTITMPVASLRDEYGANSVVYDSESNCLDDDAVLKFGKEYTVVYESDGMIKKKIINY